MTQIFKFPMIIMDQVWGMKSLLWLFTWWHHQMETFSALLAICAGNSPATGEFPAQRPVTRSFDVFFDLHLNKRLSKQSWGWWFEMLLCPLWRHCNDINSDIGLKCGGGMQSTIWSRTQFKMTILLQFFVFSDVGWLRVVLPCESLATFCVIHSQAY